MNIKILSLFPGYFKGPLTESILKRAIEAGLLSVDCIDIRSFAEDKHKTVDDRPYGGGPGMVMMPEPVQKAIDSVKTEKSQVICLSPQGEPFTAKKARALSKEQELVFLCGHYEGIDQRVLDRNVDTFISIGDYVLSNGCLAALVVIDAVARFIPGVLGDEESSEQDSFEGDGWLDCPHYTRPKEFLGMEVPEVLLSGHHQKIEAWRQQERLTLTRKVRPDLMRREKP